ncbi:hypothetical protein GBF35_22305 [Nonomuraea phyllanthi]|uniref:hypothetical protein n=1 Tax=Nonomuraea phyllanthi TaxID=2219224 RepID=UPI001293B346|nr:hypothetical protein [Nonomuraea phyllanthi]QFY09032.1 hypothetical protein GBF35_22305 [Nonomuraea phyllanthi]
MIDRRALADRHAVEVTGIDPRSPLSVGNGRLCFTADITGLQTFPGRYPVEDRTGTGPGTLLSTMSAWGWHSVPGSYDVADSVRAYRTPRGPAPYVDMRGDLSGSGESPATAAEAWLRANPHRLDLARVGLDGVAPGEVSDVRQRLDLWSGTLTSRYLLRDIPVRVTTACHPDLDVLAVRMESARVPPVRLAFPYGSQAWGNAADWTRPQAHTSRVRPSPGGFTVERVLDETSYDVAVATSGTMRRAGPHEFTVTFTGATVADLVIAFHPAVPSEEVPASRPSFEEVAAAAREHWARFWSTGGAVDLSASHDERAPELERRIVLSQYLTALHSAGPLPPAETGLLANSWRGRFHLEMHWWHAAHFPLWGRPELLERSLTWYGTALPAARRTARAQGCAGARWPKQVGPDARESPSPIGPFLIWQQPHPIYLAELVRRARGTRHALERYAPLVLETAAFMASFAAEGPAGYTLGPPLVPAQESYAAVRAGAADPTFELVYWAWALEVAQRWRRLLGLAPEPSWSRVADGMRPPLVRDGVYAAMAVPPYTVTDDHPSMLYALGFVPPTRLIDPTVMRATLRHVLAGWQWDTTWGWDYPAMAMTATRLGEPDTAIETLLMPVVKNAYLPNGHNRQSSTLPAYLPGNGGLLAAVALMAAGWDGGPPTPGFPASWTVAWEGLRPMP